MTTFEGTDFDVDYDTFRVGPSPRFELTVSGFIGLGMHDALASVSGFPFSTPDNDQDNSDEINCALTRAAGWWSANCHQANLNGEYIGGPSNKLTCIWWKDLSGGKCLKETMMMIAPVN